MVYVVGLGPGAYDYILPAAINIIEAATVVIGAKRNLDSVKNHAKDTLDLSLGFGRVGDYIKENQERNLAVVVSGDSGFYSLLSFVKRYAEPENITTIPGISSLSYFYSKLNLGYEEAKWISLHGRVTDLSEALKLNKEVAVLTDLEHNSRYIAKFLIEAGFNNKVLYVGERLSYKDEKISRLTLSQALDYEPEVLSVVVVRDE